MMLRPGTTVGAGSSFFSTTWGADRQQACSRLFLRVILFHTQKHAEPPPPLPPPPSVCHLSWRRGAAGAGAGRCDAILSAGQTKLLSMRHLPRGNVGEPPTSCAHEKSAARLAMQTDFCGWWRTASHTESFLLEMDSLTSLYVDTCRELFCRILASCFSGPPFLPGGAALLCCIGERLGR